jgi:hypothetical protein
MMKVPPLEDKELEKFLKQLLLELDRKDKSVLSKITANKSLLLLSPSLKPFEVTVSDTGVLSTGAPSTNIRAV